MTRTGKITAMRLPRIAVVLATASLVAACSSGHATITATNTAQTSTPTTATAPFAAVDPCSLVTNAQAAALQLAKDGPSVTVGVRECGWHYRTSDITQHFTLSVGIDDHRGLADLNLSAFQTQPVTGLGYPAIQTTEIDVCGVTLGTSSKSNLDVGIVTDDIPRACQLANQAVKIVIGNLPKH